ncbi:MAG TPA: sugar ABC transporter ATP-binding protein [Intrasporangium sp.]|uniref:sugar ABC transporter ATP-binding protein n=1 Tax=Intrasporangium sp. TaxID=1925024 RepID=UPI002D79B7B2|nr:sugar ABC transporter ATP-binding protein [Intrasporangium sp.]HET7397387.1 sugar ABC transporter ATP-binding protein [Intrasporangium sp.]
MSARPAIAVAGVSKTYPGVRALRAVDFALMPGEVQVLLGENGAGKSTLVKILSGAVQPDDGTIEVDGVPVALSSPHVAQRAGVSTVYQELSLVPDLSIAQNIFLGRERVRGRVGLLRRGDMNAEARTLLGLMGVDLHPSTPVRELSIAMRQVIEIVRALAREAKVLILDEPTSSLSRQETDELFARIARVRDEGVAICYISHRLEEIEQIADRVTVMRDGAVVAHRLSASTPLPELVRLMVGRSIEEEFPTRPAAAGDDLLEVEGLVVPGKVDGVSLTVRAGEVLGVFGLVGAGRTQLLRGVFGMEPKASGTVRVAGREVGITTPREAIRAGLALVPEERHAQGLVLGMSVRDNICLASLRECSRLGVLSGQRTARLADDQIRKLRVKLRDSDVHVGTLSGGNQQKVVIARALAAGSRVLLLDEPTRGVDVGAKIEIYELINTLSREGKAVVVVSSELPEILGLSDRVAVMRQGRISLVVDRAAADPETLLSAALPLTEGAA